MRLFVNSLADEPKLSDSSVIPYHLEDQNRPGDVNELHTLFEHVASSMVLSH